MGRIGNALKRAVGLDKKNKQSRPVKSVVKKLLLIPGILIFLVVVTALSLNMFAGSLWEFYNETFGSRTTSAAASVTPIVAVPSGGASTTPGVLPANATATTSTTSSFSIENAIINGEDIIVPDELKEKLMLENVTFKDLVLKTLNPYGTAGDGDERFKDIVIKTERKMKVRKHPSEAEITAYESQKRSEMWSEKEAAYNAAVSAAATPSPTPSQSASGTPAPTPTARPSGSPTPPPAPTPNAGPSAPSIGRQAENISVRPTEEAVITGTTLARPAQYDIGIVDGGGATKAPTRRPTRTPSTGTPTPRATVSPSVSPTGSGTPTPSVTGSPTASPTASGTPSPTATPIPTPTWTQSDEEELQKAVSDWVSANSKEEDTTDYVSYTISGEQLRKYMNSFHTPWQVNYCIAGYLELYDVSINTEGMSISAETAEKAYAYGNKLEYSLKVNYWESGVWDQREVSYDERESILGDCRIDYEEDHTAEPVRIDDNTDMLSCEGFYPIVLFNSIDGWDVQTSYGTRLDTMNSYGYYNQTVSGTDLSMTMESFFGHLDVEVEELSMFLDALGSMPEQERIASGLSQIRALFRPGAYVSGHIDISAFTNLDPGTQGGRAVIMGFDIVNSGAIYSQDYRYEEGFYDCSSLVNRIYMELGIDLSWWDGHWHDTTTNGLAHTFVERGLVVADHWDESVIQPGDVIMWSRPESAHHYMNVYHAGIYAGDGMIIDASTRAGHVVYRRMWNPEEVTIIARPSAGMS